MLFSEPLPVKSVHWAARANTTPVLNNTHICPARQIEVNEWLMAGINDMTLLRFFPLICSLNESMSAADKSKPVDKFQAVEDDKLKKKNCVVYDGHRILIFFLTPDS